MKKTALFALLMSCSVAASTTIILQQGLNGYTGCSDRELRKSDSGTKGGGAPVTADHMTIADGG